MAKLEQNRHGLFPGGKHGSTGGPGTGKVKRAVKNLSRKVKNKANEVASNAKKKKEILENSKKENELAAAGSSKNPRFLQGKDLPKDPDAGIRKLSPAVQTKMGYNSMSQKRMGLHQQKEERRFAQDRSDSTAIFMAGTAPGQFNNPSWKAAADSAKKANPNIDADEIKSSDIYKPTKFAPDIENSYGEVSKHLDVVNKRYGIGKKLPQDRALEAGGSRPMHQATTSQIDPLTGMPLQANAPQLGNFSGFNEIPMYDQSMSPGAIAQKRTGEYYSKQNTDYTNSNSSKIPLYERNRKINKINLMEGRGPNLDSIQKVNPEGTSDAIKSYYSPENKTQYKKDLKKSEESFSRLNKDEQYKL